MYRVQVYFLRRWQWGQIDYDTREAAENRVSELKAAGVKARIRLTSELLAG